MKKILSLFFAFVFAFGFAFPFRTSCGGVVEITGGEGLTQQQLANSLASVNYYVCGTWPSSVTIYYH